MALTTPPAFVGKITVTAGVNDAIKWEENNGAPVALSTTVAAGEYWPDALATAIQSAMNTESTASGLPLTYAWSFSVSTGLFAVAKSGGTGSFYLKNKATDTASIFTGGHTDTGGNTLSTGQWGLNHLGWQIESAYPSLGNSAVGAQSCAHYFSPTDPPQATDDGNEFPQTSVQKFAIDGTSVTYDFSGWGNSTSEFPLYGGLSRTRMIQFDFETSAQKAWWIHNFWGPYGKAGGSFRYYPDKSAGSYELHVLHGPSLESHGFHSRQMGYLWWRGTIHMHRVAS